MNFTDFFHMGDVSISPELQPAECPFLSKHIRVPTMAVTCHNNVISPISSQSVCLSLLGYCRNIAVQHGGFRGQQEDLLPM